VQARNYVVDHSSRFQEVILDHGEAEKYIANHGLPISSDHRRAWYSFTVSPTCSGDVYVIVDAQAQFDPKPELECVGLSESGDLAVYHYRVDHNVEPFMFRTTARNVFLYHFP
jgi:hypothetical protein